MAVKKICGIETEYGIIHNGPNPLNPIAASSVLINSYVSAIAKEPVPLWNFEDETPGLDARGFSPLGHLAPEVESQLVNTVLTNGARYYVDHAHPEFSSPECSNALSALLYDKAGEKILRESMQYVRGYLGIGEEIAIYKNNSDGKGNSYGCHENYLMDRATPFGTIVTGITSHFVTRQIYTGAGKVGTELPESDPSLAGKKEIPFQLSQRADFIEEEVGLETTLKRPIVNTRDEPHSYPKQYRRFHVIVGDSNMSQTATFLKLGTTAIILSMVEDNFLNKNFVFADAVGALRQISTDLTLKSPLRLATGDTITALEIQWELFDQARKYGETESLESIGEEVGTQVLDLWEEILTGLEADPMGLADRLDWVAKYRLVDGYRQRHNLKWGDVRLNALDLQYHDLRSERSLSDRVGLKELVTPNQIEDAVFNPPEDTRAYFRGKCLQNFTSNIVAINWDSIVFNLGEESLKRLPMMEPTKGTKAQVEKLFLESDSLVDLLKKIDT